MARMRGGDKAKAYLEEIGRKVGKPLQLRVGFLEKATYPGGTPVAFVAAVQEFGAPRAGIPPRPFFRNMIAAKQGEWPAAMAYQIKVANYDLEKAYSIIGAAIVGQLKQSIIQTNTPPLAPSTIARKGHSKPLIDTGNLLNSVSYDIKTK